MKHFKDVLVSVGYDQRVAWVTEGVANIYRLSVTVMIKLKFFGAVAAKHMRSIIDICSLAQVSNYVFIAHAHLLYRLSCSFFGWESHEQLVTWLRCHL